MNLAVVGCGYVFDIYMRTFRAHPQLKIVGVFDINADRAMAVGEYYGFTTYQSYSELLSDPSVDLVLNLTSIGSHYQVSRDALMAGKHVYSEKPLATDVDDCDALFSLAKEKGLVFTGAPGNIFSDTVRTMLNAVQAGKIGKPLLVYAELDDNPIHHMQFENVVSPSGAPWPLEEEVFQGCTYEHVGYHLIWICALLGPAISVTAFSQELINNKLSNRPGMTGTPDYSVASLLFENGAVARVTCSVVAPRDHRMRIIGEGGEIHSEGYRQFRAPVYFEKFSHGSLSARKFSTLRRSSILGRMFGIGGRRIPLMRNSFSHGVERDYQARSTIKTRAIEWLRRREVYAQDKFAAVAEMAREIENQSAPYLSPDFLKHINELTLLIQNAGSAGAATIPKSSFNPLGPMPD